MRKLLVVLLALAVLPVVSAGPIYQFTVDTTSIGTADGYLAFNFSPGNAFGVLDAWVRILSFSPSGSLAEPGTVTGDVTSPSAPPQIVPGPLTIRNTEINNDYFVSFHFDATPIVFLLAFGGPGVDSPAGATSGSTFGFGLFDASGLPLATNREDGYAAIIDVNPDGTTTPTVFPGGVDGEPPVTSLAEIPEPATGLLLAGALAVLLRFRRRT
jgi:hypothetical protein